MFKKLISGAKKLIKGVGRAIKKVGKAVKSALKSPFVKALIIGAAVFFGVPWVAGALQVGSASAAGMTGAAWWKSTLGLGAAAAAPAAAGVAPVAGTAGVAQAGTAAMTTAPVAAGAGLGPSAALDAYVIGGTTGNLTGPMSTLAGGSSVGAGGGLLAPPAAGESLLQSEVLKTTVGDVATKKVTNDVSKNFAQRAVAKLGETWSGLGDTAKAAVISGGMQAAGNVIKGYAEGAAKDEELKREDELLAAQSVYGVRRDGSNADQAYDPAAILREATAGYQHRGLLGPTATDAMLPPDPADRYRA